MAGDQREIWVMGISNNGARGDVVCGYLRDAGYACRIASAGDLASKKPLGVVLDLSPYADDSWGTLIKLKSSVETRDIPVLPVFLSEEGNIGAVFPVTGFFTLPIDEEYLVQRLSVLGLTDEVEDWDLQALMVSRTGEEKVSKVLESVGFEVVKAYTGKEAVAVSTIGRQYLAFSILMLSDISAFDLLERLRLYPQTRNLPFFVLLKDTMKEGEKQALSKEIAHLVRKKEITKEEFLSYLRRRG